jgi:hypothetical protein
MVKTKTALETELFLKLLEFWLHPKSMQGHQTSLGVQEVLKITLVSKTALETESI